MDVRPGRDEALSRLFEAHYADTVRLGFYLTGSWAAGEDLAQEAFVRLWRRWGGLRDHHAALGYLRTTVVDLSRSALRRRLLELRHQGTIGEEGYGDDPVAQLDVARALAALPAGKRACVVLRHLVDLSVEETAAVLGIVAARIRLDRAFTDVGDVMAVGAGSLWGTFANSADDAGVQRVDPVTGRVVATIRIPDGVLMAFGLGTLWVAQDAPTITSGGNEPVTVRPGKLYRIDPTSNRAPGRPVPLPGIAPSALAVGEGAVWVGELDGKTLTRFNLAP